MGAIIHTISYQASPQFLKTEFNKALKMGFGAAAAFWHRGILPAHFTHAGATRYGYDIRGSRYNRYKLKRFGHTYPLRFTSDLYRSVRRTPQIASTAKHGRVGMKAPKYLYKYRKDRKQPDKAAELTQADRKDGLACAKVLDTVVENYMKATRKPETYTPSG